MALPGDAIATGAFQSIGNTRAWTRLSGNGDGGGDTAVVMGDDDDDDDDGVDVLRDEGADLEVLPSSEKKLSMSSREGPPGTDREDGKDIEEPTNVHSGPSVGASGAARGTSLPFPTVHLSSALLAAASTGAWSLFTGTEMCMCVLAGGTGCDSSSLSGMTWTGRLESTGNGRGG